MKPFDANVDTYIEEQPAEWQPALRKLRSECRKELRGYTENMSNGIPSYQLNGRTEVGFAKQARYLSLYVLKQPVVEAHRPDLAGLSVGKGCIRYRRPEQVDWAVVASLLAGAYTSAVPPC
jgi:uncharacterized protein YdhG (YjbR/CyaY superfamily)